MTFEATKCIPLPDGRIDVPAADIWKCQFTRTNNIATDAPGYVYRKAINNHAIIYVYVGSFSTMVKKCVILVTVKWQSNTYLVI